MKLYVHPFSQHSRRVLMLCHELGVEIDTELVDLAKGQHKSEEYLARGIIGTVPLLEDGDFFLSESHAIMRYIVDQTGDDTFYPRDPRSRGWIDAWLDWTHVTLNPPVQTILLEGFKGHRADSGRIATAREAAMSALSVLERGFSQPSRLGTSPSLADFSLASTLALYEMADFPLDRFSDLRGWYDTIRSRPSFVTTAPQTDRLS